MIYRRFCFLFVVFSFLASVQCFGQSKKDKIEKLYQIRLKTRAINTEKNYKVTKIEDAELILGQATDGGASITGYYKAGTFQKIIEWIGLSNRVLQNEYYLDSGKLIFVYATESQYAFNDSLQTLDYTKLVPHTNGRYYFDNGRLFNAIFSNKQLENSKREDALRFLRQATTYKALLAKNIK